MSELAGIEGHLIQNKGKKQLDAFSLTVLLRMSDTFESLSEVRDKLRSSKILKQRVALNELRPKLINDVMIRRILEQLL